MVGTKHRWALPGWIREEHADRGEAFNRPVTLGCVGCEHLRIVVAPGPKLGDKRAEEGSNKNQLLISFCSKSS